MKDGVKTNAPNGNILTVLGPAVSLNMLFFLNNSYKINILKCYSKHARGTFFSNWKRRGNIWGCKQKWLKISGWVGGGNKIISHLGVFILNALSTGYIMKTFESTYLKCSTQKYFVVLKEIFHFNIV